MPRNRMIKVEFWSDAKVNRLGFGARLLYMGMWNFSDDYGTIEASPLKLHGNIFDMDKSVQTKDVESFLSEIEKQGMIKRFTADEKEYYYIVHFLDHQKISKKSERTYPAPPKAIAKECSENVTGMLQVHPRNVPKDKGNDKDKSKGKDVTPQHGESISIQSPCVTIAQKFVHKIDKSFTEQSFNKSYHEGDNLKILKIIRDKLLKELGVGIVSAGFEQLIRDGTESINDALNLKYNGHNITFKFRELANGATGGTNAIEL